MLQLMIPPPPFDKDEDKFYHRVSFDTRKASALLCRAKDHGRTPHPEDCNWTVEGNKFDKCDVAMAFVVVGRPTRISPNGQQLMKNTIYRSAKHRTLLYPYSILTFLPLCFSQSRESLRLWSKFHLPQDDDDDDGWAHKCSEGGRIFMLFFFSQPKLFLYGFVRVCARYNVVYCTTFSRFKGCTRMWMAFHFTVAILNIFRWRSTARGCQSGLNLMDVRKVLLNSLRREEEA